MKKIKGLLLKDILQTKSYFISNCLLCLLFCILFVFQIFAFKNGGSGNGYNTGMPEAVSYTHLRAHETVA